MSAAKKKIEVEAALTTMGEMYKPTEKKKALETK